MKDYKKFGQEIQSIHAMLLSIFGLFIIAAFAIIFMMYNPDIFSSATTEEYVELTLESEEDFDKIENGIHVRTGLKDATGLMTVVNNCTNCHSAKLVTQNRMNRERWEITIKWMQETQNLWDLGPNKKIIIDYLVTNYPVAKKGRRETLMDIDWYELE